MTINVNNTPIFDAMAADRESGPDKDNVIVIAVEEIRGNEHYMTTVHLFKEHRFAVLFIHSLFDACASSPSYGFRDQDKNVFPMVTFDRLPDDVRLTLGAIDESELGMLLIKQNMTYKQYANALYEMTAGDRTFTVTKQPVMDKNTYPHILDPLNDIDALI